MSMQSIIIQKTCFFILAICAILHFGDMSLYADVKLPQKDCEGEWIVCSPDTLKLFSGVAYYFGRKLHVETD